MMCNFPEHVRLLRQTIQPSKIATCGLKEQVAQPISRKTANYMVAQLKSISSAEYLI
jgi:hypothetical protein